MGIRSLQYGYASTPHGQVHYVSAGQGPCVLCLHQTPRSWDEFREVMPLLAEHFLVLAMDTPGMGGSACSTLGASIDAYAHAAVGLLDALDVSSTALVGHHTGGVIAVRAAALLGSRVTAAVLSSTPYVDAEARQARANRKAVDHYEEVADGSHLQGLWNQRAAFYPPGRPDLQRRYLIDALRATDPEQGHRAVAAYRMEDDIGQLRAPTLVIAHAQDPYAAPEAPRLASALADAQMVTIEDGMVPLEFTAPAFAAYTRDHLLGVDAASAA